VKNISKKIFCKESGKCFGYVLDVSIDFEKFEIVGYYVVEEESENEYFVSLEKILVLSSFVLVQREGDFEFVSNRKGSLFGRSVVSQKGQDFGCVCGLEFCGKRFAKILTDKAEIAAKHIGFVGDDVIFAFEKTRPRKLSVTKKKNKEILVSILSKKDMSLKAPDKVRLTPESYIGKVCHRDIFGYNKERLVSKGEMVSKVIFDKAKMHNRLNELFFAIEDKKKK